MKRVQFRLVPHRAGCHSRSTRIHPVPALVGSRSNHRRVRFELTNSWVRRAELYHGPMVGSWTMVMLKEMHTAARQRRKLNQVNLPHESGL